jgi:hypothetical protein
MTVARKSHGIYRIIDAIYVFGGKQETSQLTLVEYYDKFRREWIEQA